MRSRSRPTRCMCPRVQPPWVQVPPAVRVIVPASFLQAMSALPMDTEAEVVSTEAGVPWRTDIAATPLMQDLMGALATELASSEAQSALPMKLLDSREDRDENEPDVPINGSEIMEIGKYAKAGMMKTFAQIYVEDKNYVQWIRKFVTTSKPNSRGQSSSSSMMRLRLYIACRDQLKEKRVRADKQVESLVVDFNPPYVDPKMMTQGPVVSPLKLTAKAKATQKPEIRNKGTMKQAAASSDGYESWEAVEPRQDRSLKAVKEQILKKMLQLQRELEDLEEVEREGM